MQNPELLGTGVSIATCLLGAYYLTLRIKEFYRENPDPKLTYATHAQLERTRAELMRAIADAVQDIKSLRAEIRQDAQSAQAHYLQSLSETRELISKNAQNISALIAQAQLSAQRIAELTLKTDKLAIMQKERH